MACYSASLIDLENLMQGTGAKMRHIKVKMLAEANNPALIDLLKQAKIEQKLAFTSQD